MRVIELGLSLSVAVAAACFSIAGGAADAGSAYDAAAG